MRWITPFKMSCLVLLSLTALISWVLVRPRASAVPPPPAAVELAADAGTPDLDAGTEDPTTATVVFVTMPNVTATVTWGRKTLGKILPGKPLVVVRPRDSGPLDVMVRAAGYLTVQTRAHTFSNTRVLVKLTPPSKKNELLGYRVPLEAGVDGGDGAVAWPEGLEAGISFGWDAGVTPLAAPAPVQPAAAPPSFTP